MNDRQALDPERVLVLAPTTADAALTQSILAEAGLACRLCADLAELNQALSEGAGAILLTEAALAASDVHHLVEALQDQPPWSDIPILLLAEMGADSSGAAWAMAWLGNVMVLERPVRLTTLVSALRTALRARRRQYELRDQLSELQHAEAALRTQGERRRLLWEAATVLLTTDQPELMLRTLFAKIAPHFQLDAYFNFMVNETGEALQLKSCLGIPDTEARKIPRLEFGQAVCGTVALHRQPLVATHIQQSDDPRVQWVKGYGLRAYACNPLIAEGQLLGTLSFASRQRDQFDAEELEFLRTLCQYVTAAYERLRLIHELQDTDRRKDEFLATLAHELRNPLAPLRNSLQILRLARDNPAAAERAQDMMARQLQHMVRLIDDLLDLSRIRRGKIQLQKAPVDVRTIVQQAVETSRPLITQSGHVLILELPAEAIVVDADATRLAQAIANVLNNAAKYTDSGGRLLLTVARQGRDAVVRVQDNGIGIPPAMLPRVFDLFTQVDQSLEKSQGGLGIGLSLVKQLVELHGGTVEAHSEGRGKGSEFILRVPALGTSRSTSQAPAARKAPLGTPVPHRILVVDDNRDAALSLALMLELMGHEIRMAHDGMAALEVAAEFRPELILLDIGMPRLNGYDTCRRLREAPWGREMVIVALTGWGQDADRRQSQAAGFSHHLVKPVDPAILGELLAASLQDQGSQLTQD